MMRHPCNTMSTDYIKSVQLFWVFITKGIAIFPQRHSGWAAVIDSQGDKPLPWGSVNPCMDTLPDKQLALWIQTRQPIRALLLSPPVCKWGQEFAVRHSRACRRRWKYLQKNWKMNATVIRRLQRAERDEEYTACVFKREESKWWEWEVSRVIKDGVGD